MNKEQIDSANGDILLLSTSDPKKAFQEAKLILAQCAILDYQKGTAEALRNLAFSSQSLGFLQEGYEFAKDAIVQFEKLDDKKNLAHVYNTLGFIYDHLNEQENRLISNLKSRAYSHEINDSEGLIRSLNNTGDNYIQLANYKDALQSFEECIALIQPTNYFMFAVVYCNIGEVHFLQNQLSKAIENFNRSLEHARRIKSFAIEATALLLLSKVYIKQDKDTDAIFSLKKAIDLFDNAQKEQGDLIFFTDKDQENSILKSSINIEIEIYQLYSEILEKTGDLPTALWAIKKNKALEKILIIEKHTKEFETVHLRYEITQLEKLVAERTSELERTFLELQTKENNNRLIIENAIDAVIIFDEQGKIIQHNKKTSDFFFKPNDLKNYTLTDLLYFEDGTKLKAVIDKLFNVKIDDFESLKFEMTDETVTEYFQVAFTRTKIENSYQGIAFIGNVSHYKKAEKKRLMDLEIETRINHFSQFILSKNDYRELLFELVRMCIEELKFYTTTIYLKENNSDDLVQIVNQQAETYSKLDSLNNMKSANYLLTSDTAEFITSKEIKSQLSIPLKIAGELMGVINCGHYEADFFDENHIRFLMTIAPLLANRVDKLKEQIQKELLQKELFEINQKLEQEVDTQTKKITELTHKYLEHEKLSLLAELASSISHELNTPFGIIKNGAIEVNNTIISLFQSIENGSYSKEILDFIIQIAQNKSNIPFTSGRQKRRDLIDFSDLLQTKNIDPTILSELAHGFVNAKFSMNDTSEIEFILNSGKQLDILHNIFFLQKTLSLSKTIIETSNSAALIVKELTNIAKGSKALEITKINLLDNIHSVLSVYKYNFETIPINIDVAKDIELLGSEINLFQLWKNTFLLANYSFENVDIEKYIHIKALENETSILVEFSYNGEEINPDYLENLMDVTPIIDPSNKNILSKLSLIKKIATDHNGKLTIQSTNQVTSISFELPRLLNN